MKLHRSNLTLIFALALTGWAIAAEPSAPSVGADDALARLKVGNQRFASSKVSAGKPIAARKVEWKTE